ncbi:olfactory receptor 2AT4-like [Salvelinus alpinus]|uniref:olfactory receptor 2AT4-like n=1 Tax=Salvelinus alpinus TaxID=8036 RepID=UPI0039FBA4BC
MSAGNHSFVTEFVIVGFPGLQPEFYGLASTVLFLVYFCTTVGNVVILVLFATDRDLHKPMYFVILHLVVSDILFSTTTLPKIIARYWFQAGAISFTGCFVQMYLVHYLGTVNSYILFIMALDRYVSICFPLRYPMIIKNSTIHILSTTAWIVAKAGPLMMVIRAYPLPYCDSNKIMQCYCDHIAITTLACTDRAPYSFPAFVVAMVVLLGPLAFIIFSYCSIIVAVVQIASTQGRLKTLSTCSGQLIIIALYYLPRCFIYLSSNIGIRFSTDLRIVIIMLYSLLPPMINPLIYCFKTKYIKQSLMKRFKRSTDPQKERVSAIQALDGRTIGSGQVEYHTQPILIQVGVNHSETLSFLLVTAPENNRAGGISSPETPPAEPTICQEVYHVSQVRFIRNFGAVAAPLMVLTRKSQTHFCWTPEVDRAFMELKGRFTSGPILIHPDPTRPFVVEVAASDTGAGAGRFHTSLSPVIQNQKSDALSRQHDVYNEERDSDLIILSSRIVAPVIWRIETTVRQAQTREPDPSGRPTDILYVL